MDKIYIENTTKRINPFAYLRSKCIENGKVVSIRRLDELMGCRIGHSHISEIEKGRKPATLNQLKTYHEYFNVSYEFLLGETDEINSLSNGKVPVIYTDIDQILYQLSMSGKKSSRNKWEMVRMLLTTDKGQLLLSYLSELLERAEHEAIYKKIDVLLNQDELLTYNELLIKVENEVNAYDNQRNGSQT